VKKREEELGRESEEFINYLCEIMKVFNQTGMSLMNSG
jgi:hypothetical protein